MSPGEENSDPPIVVRQVTDLYDGPSVLQEVRPPSGDGVWYIANVAWPPEMNARVVTESIQLAFMPKEEE